MRLTDLEPQFIKHSRRREVVRLLKPGIKPTRYEEGDFEEREVDRDYFTPVSSLTEADGIRFLSPIDFVKNGGAVGTSCSQVFFVGKVPYADVGTNMANVPQRWVATGTCYDDLTLSPSIQEQPNGWHGFVTNGEVTNA
jgi:hypothetical protein